MKSFKINNTYDLSLLNEEVITIKKIKATSINDLFDLHLIVTKKHENGSISKYPIPTFDKKLGNSNVSEINIDHKITECAISTLTIEKPQEKSFEIFYETIEDKLNRLLEEEDSSRSNIGNEIKKWRGSIDLLINKISSWITYGDKVGIETEMLTINEDRTGTYNVNQFTIKPLIGKQIMFKPRGTFIIGAKGRIDIYIPNYGKDLMLLLDRIKGKDKWYLIVDMKINNKMEFTKSQFLNLLDDALTL